MSDSTTRFSVSTIAFLAALVIGAGMWAGVMQAEVNNVRAEYGDVLREVRDVKERLIRIEARIAQDEKP